MDYQVVLSTSARRDLCDIVRYISFDNPQKAKTFGMMLVTKTKMLGQQPQMGREVPEMGNPLIREIIVGHIVLFIALIAPIKKSRLSDFGMQLEAHRRFKGLFRIDARVFFS